MALFYLGTGDVSSGKSVIFWVLFHFTIIIVVALVSFHQVSLVFV